MTIESGSQNAFRESNGKSLGLAGEEETSQRNTDLILGATIALQCWSDPLLDQLGYRSDSDYTEYFWLPILGPSSVWLLRRVAQILDLTPGGTVVDTGEFGRSLGLGGTSNGRSLLSKTLSRCIYFDTAKATGVDSFAFKRKLAPLSRRQLDRLPNGLQSLHGVDKTHLFSKGLSSQSQNAKKMALSLFQLGEDRQAISSQLQKWKFSDDIRIAAMKWLDSEARYLKP